MFDKNQPAYEDFRAILRERTTPIVAWIGSGLSVPAGVPTWASLCEQLCEALESKAKTFEEEERDRLLGELDAARNARSYWIAFRVLKKAMGETTYRDSVRAALRVAATASVPQAYRSIWRIGVSGVLNLNLDRLATRASSEVHTDGGLTEFPGCDAGRYLHLLKSPRPFVANLHGTVEDYGSWVFTHDEMTLILRNEGYRRLIESCLASRTILFVGIRANDVAVGGHLEQLAHAGIDIGTHFWITDIADPATDSWAERTGIRVIRYHNPDGDHTELSEFFGDLLSFIPQESPAAPVDPRAVSEDALELSDPAEMVQHSAEHIRLALNSRATEILEADDSRKYDDYQRLCERYDQAIYRAWYTSTQPPDNVLMGYSLVEEMAAGAFGTVYRAHDQDGQTCAIKVLHERVRSDRQMLQGFRRGVSSMRILKDRNVTGIVPYLRAFEIPAFVVMELVEGPTLQEAVDNRIVDGWETVLHIAVELADVIRRSHHLPERVLHRDIRPSNIMLRNGWQRDEEWELLVLDFDLSWHRDAPEVSITSVATANAYLAPEQIYRTKNESTRNAAVDSFGLGMTLFFMATRKTPQIMQHRQAEWPTVLRNYASSLRCNEWWSLPIRYFRLIEAATKHAQAERWDVSQILGELERIRDVLTLPTRTLSAEMLAEELACRATNRNYEWDSDRVAAIHTSPTGMSARVFGNESERRVEVTIEWQQANPAQYSSVTKWIPKASERASSILQRAGWTVTGGTNIGYSVGVQANVSTTVVASRIGKHARALDDAISALTFDHA